MSNIKDECCESSLHDSVKPEAKLKAVEYYHRIARRPFSSPEPPILLTCGTRALAGPDFLSMRRVFVSYSQPIRLASFDGKSEYRGLPVLDQARA